MRESPSEWCVPRWTRTSAPASSSQICTAIILGTSLSKEPEANSQRSKPYLHQLFTRYSHFGYPGRASESTPRDAHNAGVMYATTYQLVLITSCVCIWYRRVVRIFFYHLLCWSLDVFHSASIKCVWVSSLFIAFYFFSGRVGREWLIVGFNLCR